MLCQVCEASLEFSKPGFLTDNSRMTKLATIMLLFYSIDYQVGDGHPLCTKRVEISFGFAHAHALRNRNEHERGLACAEEKVLNTLYSFVQIGKKKIDVVSNELPANKMGDHVPVLIGHVVQGSHHASKDLG